MATPSSGHGRPVVPPEEQRCIWMSAGILTYQLCDHGLDCENCPLDVALRAHFGHAGEGVPAEPPPAPRSTALPDDRRYSRRHCWVRPVEGASPPAARVGLEPALAAALPGVRGVVPPLPDDRARAGEVHFWLVTDGGTFPLPAPVGGRLLGVNPALAERPHLAAALPLDEGWLYEIELDEPDPDGVELMDAPAATAAYAEDARRFRVELRRALQTGAGSAPVLADGGALLGDLSRMLGPEKYFALLWWVFG
jgi:glycine cleavage system H protein